MSTALFDLHHPALPIAGEDSTFPIRRVYCIGRNYAAHAREMGSDPAVEAPIFFMKPADAVTLGRGSIPFPADTENLHHEVELVVALQRGGRDIEPADAESLIFGYAVGLDLTKRDRQAEAKQAGYPWERSKAFDRSAPVSSIRPITSTGPLREGRIWLSVNGEMRQSADLGDMIWDVPNLLARLSRIWALSAGDLIFTGTPDGVGSIERGDRIMASVEHVGQIEMTIG